MMPNGDFFFSDLNSVCDLSVLGLALFVVFVPLIFRDVLVLLLDLVTGCAMLARTDEDHCNDCAEGDTWIVLPKGADAELGKLAA